MLMNHKNLWHVAFGIVVAILLRCCTSLHSYSGQHIPPMFGDYEAQRHWMEITVNLPVHEWYKNTTKNDLNYWGLDYPPLTAYHSLLCGYIAKWVNEDYISLNKSRGYESSEHKLFMRYTVLIVDILFFFSSVCAYFYNYNYHSSKYYNYIPIADNLKSKKKNDLETKICNSTEKSDKLKKRNKNDLEKEHAVKSVIKQSSEDNIETPKKNRKKKVTFAENVTVNSNVPKPENDVITYSLVLSLLYPGLILIDHGHFQYNCVSLGFFIYAVAFLYSENLLLTSFFFTLALNYKQMELYHALPFFFYLLSTCIFDSSFKRGILKLVKISFVVLLTFLIIWIPFLFNISTVMQVVHRLFPLARGVFEDKVSNFWCALNVFYKLKNHFTNVEMAKLCLILTSTFSLPSNIDLFFRPNINKVLLALINTSLAFFLFSFQVHEKSILLVAVPVMLYFPHNPFACFWFLMITVFSMLPLLIKDDLVIAFIALSIFYFSAFFLTIGSNNIKPSIKCKNNTFFKDILITLLNIQNGETDASELFSVSIYHLFTNQRLVYKVFLSSLFVLSIFGCVSLTILISVFNPPDKLPDLFSLLISVYSFGHFIIFFIYFNYCQLVVSNKKSDNC